MSHRQLDITPIKGSPREAGRMYGEAFAIPTMGFCQREVAPTPKRLAYARRCWPYVEKYAPVSARFMQGMAEGSRVSIEHLTLLTLHEEIFHLPHCTAFVASGDETRDGKTLNVQNWDWACSSYVWPGFLKLAIKGSPRILSYHYPGLWTGAGINEAGLSFMWTSSGLFPKIAPVNGLPTYVLIHEILRRGSVEEAVSYIEGVRRAGSFIFLLADAGKRTAIVEGTPARVVVDRSARVMCRANHYACPEMVAFSKQKVRRKRLFTTGPRFRRMNELMREYEGKISVPVARRILTDRHGNWPWLHQYPGGAHSVSLVGMTLDSLIAVSETRSLHTCRGGYTPGPWREIAL